MHGKLTRTRRIQIGLTAVAFVVLILLMVPLFWMISSSVKSEKDIVTMRWIPSELRVENYRIILERAKIGRWFINSAVVSVCGTTGIVFISLLAGYSLGRLDFPGREFFVLSHSFRIYDTDSFYNDTALFTYENLGFPQFILGFYTSGFGVFYKCFYHHPILQRHS